MEREALSLGDMVLIKRSNGVSVAVLDEFGDGVRRCECVGRVWMPGHGPAGGRWTKSPTGWTLKQVVGFAKEADNWRLRRKVFLATLALFEIGNRAEG